MVFFRGRKCGRVRCLVTWQPLGPLLWPPLGPLLWLAGAVGLQSPSCVRAQTPAPVAAPAPTSAADPATAALAAMAARAGVIFAGQVQAVTRNDAGGFVDIRFHIDVPVRGCPQVGAYVLREWAGLWTQSASERYVPGQRYLLLLTARGPSGLSAPVDNTDGAFPLVAASSQDGGAGALDVNSLASAFAVDLRWLRAKAERRTAVTWAGSGGDDLNQPVSGGAPAAHEGGAIAPLSPVRREPLLQTLLPLLARTRPEGHAAR